MFERNIQTVEGSIRFAESITRFGHHGQIVSTQEDIGMPLAPLVADGAKVGVFQVTT